MPDYVKALLIVLSLAVLVVLVAVASYHPVDRSVNFVSDGVIDGKPFHTEVYNDDSLPLGPETRRAFVLAAVGQPQQDAFAALGQPTQVNQMSDPSYTRNIYAYRDGWIDVMGHNGTICMVTMFGPYVNPSAYPPVQSAIAEQNGKPVKQTGEP
jgi:hypothetical protein